MFVSALMAILSAVCLQNQAAHVLEDTTRPSLHLLLLWPLLLWALFTVEDLAALEVRQLWWPALVVLLVLEDQVDLPPRLAVLVMAVLVLAVLVMAVLVLAELVLAGLVMDHHRQGWWWWWLIHHQLERT